MGITFPASWTMRITCSNVHRGCLAWRIAGQSVLKKLLLQLQSREGMSHLLLQEETLPQGRGSSKKESGVRNLGPTALSELKPSDLGHWCHAFKVHKVTAFTKQFQGIVLGTQHCSRLQKSSHFFPKQFVTKQSQLLQM